MKMELVILFHLFGGKVMRFFSPKERKEEKTPSLIKFLLHPSAACSGRNRCAEGGKRETHTEG